MSETEINDAAVLEQVRDHWQKVAAMLVWKLQLFGQSPVHLTNEFIASFPLGHVLLTHGHRDSIELSLVTAEAAAKIISHDASTNRGHA